MLPSDISLSWRLLMPILICGIAVRGSDDCYPGLETGGWIHPKGDQFVEADSPFELYCVLNDSRSIYPNATSKDVTFYIDDVPVLDSRVSVYNETAIRLTVERSTVPEHHSYYAVSCKLFDKKLCARYVYVGYKPQEVTNFSCLSQNWENLTCTWDEPRNPIKTDYVLYYASPSRSPSYQCPINGRSDGSCTWTRMSTPPYRAVLQKFKFFMKASNNLTNNAKITQNLSVLDHFAIVLPSKMENLTVVNVTKSSTTIYWNVPEPLWDFPPGLEYRVSYRPLPRWARNVETFADTVLINKTAYRVDFTIDLPYAGVSYEIKVSAKSKDAVDLWSEPAVMTVRTAPDYPCGAPRTLDTFEIIRSELLIYWNPVDPECQNGDRFQYSVTLLTDGVEEMTRFVDGTLSSVNLGKVDLQKDHFVRIFALNEVGASATSSTIYVPASNQLLPKPRDVTTVVHSNSLVEVLWKPPRETASSSDSYLYTVFWCLGQVSGAVCNGQLDWSEMDDNTFGYNITLTEAEKDLDIAVFVAARKGDATSGMEGSTCEIRPTTGINTVNGVTIVGETTSSVTVNWPQIGCKSRLGPILFYRVYYCVADKDGKCEGPDMVLVVDSSDDLVELANLDAFTRYSIRVAVVSTAGEGSPSEPVIATTLRARPTEPRDLRVTSVTNSSFVIQWSPPLRPNGVIRSYGIAYNSDSDVVTVGADQNEVVISDVLSYKEYVVKIRACQEDFQCSVYSEPVSVMTEIGAPGNVKNLRVVFTDNVANVSWSRPDNLGGPSPRYMIRIDSLNYTSIFIPQQNDDVMFEEISVEDCGESGKLEALVAAFNEADDRIVIYGAWESEEAFCYAPGLSLEALLGVIFTVVIVALVLIVAAVQIYWYLQKKKLTQRLKPLLPWERQTPGLSKPDENKSNTRAAANVYTSKPSSYDRLTSVTATLPLVAEPAELTVLKNGSSERHGRSRSGDSSGCSSGHESLSSHQTGGNRESYTNDSGTEMDTPSPTPDVFPEYAVEDIKVDGIIKGSLPSVHYTKPPVDPEMGLVSPDALGSFSVDKASTPSSYVRVGLDPVVDVAPGPSVCRDGYVTLGLNENRPSHSPNASPCLSTTSNESVQSDRQLLPNKYALQRPVVVSKGSSESSLLRLGRPDQSDTESEKDDHFAVPEIEFRQSVSPSGYVTADMVKMENPKTVSGYVTLGGIDNVPTDRDPAPMTNSHYVALGLNQFNV